jgi:hypothetical protein
MATLIRATYPEPEMVLVSPGESLPPVRQVGEEVRPANGTDFKLAEAQALVGGLIEVFPLNDGRIMVCNEEGKLEHLPVNVEATILFRRTYGPVDTIVGDVIVCQGRELR